MKKSSITFEYSVKLENISKSFGTRKVLEEIDFSVNKGEGLCICGSNAAGKTTILKVICGLLKPDKGNISILGISSSKEPEKIKEHIGIVLDKSMVYDHLTVLENLKFFASLYGVPEKNKKIDSLLELTELLPYRNEHTGILSKGMIQRLSVARAMLHAPSVILADEPFSGLDKKAAKKLIEILCEFKLSGGSFIMTTHNVTYAFDCCNEAAVLDSRKIIFRQRIEKIQKDDFIRDYLEYAKRGYMG